MKKAGNIDEYSSRHLAAGRHRAVATAVATDVARPVRERGQRGRSRRVRKGTRIFDTSASFLRMYRVASGEVLILRGGRPVDLVEAGEMLDPRLWRDATAIAYTDCTLASPRPCL